MRTFASMTLAGLLAGPVLAAEPPSPAVLEAALAGKWQGTLGYRDYQTDKLEELPFEREVWALADGATVLSIATFDDGPRVGAVTVTTAALFDLKAGTVTSVSLRKGRPVETDTDRVRVSAYRDATRWTVTSERDGTDDGKPAKLRTIQQRDGDTLTSVKEVLPATAAAKGWQFRNRTRLTRLP